MMDASSDGCSLQDDDKWQICSGAQEIADIGEGRRAGLSSSVLPAFNA
jgi:hypothetical protein